MDYMDKSYKGRSKKKSSETKTQAAINKSTARPGGPTAMYTPDPMRLSKGKYKGTE